jgi:hypothetical protein
MARSTPTTHDFESRQICLQLNLRPFVFRIFQAENNKSKDTAYRVTQNKQKTLIRKVEIMAITKEAATFPKLKPKRILDGAGVSSSLKRATPSKNINSTRKAKAANRATGTPPISLYRLTLTASQSNLELTLQKLLESCIPYINEK